MVFIKELLPNPAGKDTDGEWITLLNDGDTSVSLRGWSLSDTSGKKFVFGSETLQPKQELKLLYSLTRIGLNNDGDTVTLRDAKGSKVDELNYGQVSEEEIVVSSKVAPPPRSEELVQDPPLTAQAFSGGTISPETISPFLIALGLALGLGTLAAFLSKKLIES